MVYLFPVKILEDKQAHNSGTCRKTYLTLQRLLLLNLNKMTPKIFLSSISLVH